MEAARTTADTCTEVLAAELLVDQVSFVTFDVACRNGRPTRRDDAGLEPGHAVAHDDICRVSPQTVSA